jgi:hypothetical protein
MKLPKLNDLRVWYTPDPPKLATHIHVRNLAEALTALVTIEAITAYESVWGIRREVQFECGVQRFEPGEGWVDVEDWELAAVQEVLDAEAA